MKPRRLTLQISLAAVLTLVLLGAGTTLATAVSAAQVIADTPNDATQGRLRINQCVEGAPQVDVYVNRQQAVNGGVPQTLRTTETSGYLYLPPRTYSVALVPAGQGLDHPFLGPLDVQVAAGHRYTVVALGQQDDATHKALVIDETAAYQAIGAERPDGQHLAHITVNNIKDAPSIHFSLGGVAEPGAAAYGEFEAGLWPAFAPSIDVVTANSPAEIIAHADGPIFNPPGSDNMDCVFGTYPATNNSNTTATTSILSPADFLQHFNELGPGTGGQTPTFHTFVAALQQTGLGSMLASGGSYLVFAPTDDAFAALPPDQLAALLADRKALADVVRAQIVPGYYPLGTLVDRTVTNTLGTPLVLTGAGSADLIVNGETVGNRGDYVMVANGTRLLWTSKAILPAPLPANPAPGMPITGAEPSPADWFAAFSAALVLLLAGGLLRRKGAMRRL